jgi:hypothetical protein
MAPAVMGTVALWSTIAASAASVGSSIYGMVKGAPSLPAPSKDSARAATEAAYAAYNQARARRGASSTILTGPAGVAPQAQQATRTTLGG